MGGWCKDEIVSYSEFCELGIEDFVVNEIVLYFILVNEILII